MAKSSSGGNLPKGQGRPTAAGWAALTWDHLDRWAGGRSVERGRSYQRGGRVKDLAVSGDGDLLATVVGGERYATTVTLATSRKGPTLDSACTCPVGASGCKHAVAVVAEYLQALADGRAVGVASDEDPRWADLEDASAELDDGWDDEDDAPWDDDEEEPPPRASRSRKAPPRRSADLVNWDDRIERHLRAKTQGELADLVWSLTRRFPEIYQEFRERLALQEGDVGRLLTEARREIKKVTSEPAWRDRWSGGGHTPDYSRIKHRFERLLELGHPDEVVALGRDFLREGQRQVSESHDEGEAAQAFADCLAVVFQALSRSSLSGPEQLLFAIDAEMDDDIEAVGEATSAVLDATYPPEDWSAVADTLAGRLKAIPAGKGKEADSFSRSYARDRLTRWIASALEEAGRDEEVRALYESEAPVTGSYERLVAFLLERSQIEDAERWAKEGISATVQTLPGIAAHLTESLCEVARKRNQWDVVAAHAARKFFEHPAPSTFEELIKAAGKAGVGEPVRAAALQFLETGAMPYQVIAPKPAAVPASRNKSAARGRAASASARKGLPPVDPKPPAPDRVKVGSAWPLPVPEYLIPLMNRPRYDPEPRPRLDVLLEMAIAAKRPDDVLHWFDKMRSEASRPGSYQRAPSYADRVAEAVSRAHPERAVDAYLTGLKAQLPKADYAAYENAAGYLKKLRPLFAALGRAGEWAALVTSIRETYRNRPRFMEILDRLEGRPIVQTSRSRRK